MSTTEPINPVSDRHEASEGYWECVRCGEQVSPSHVTYTERHDGQCGGACEWVDVKPKIPSEETRLRGIVNETYKLLYPIFDHDEGNNGLPKAVNALILERDAAVAEVQTAHALLRRIAYPNRGTEDEMKGIQDFANEIQATYSLDQLS